MFISKEEIQTHTGYEVSTETLNIAQMMIETWVGRTEAEVDDPRDIDVLGRATMFQAVYVSGNVSDMLEQAAVKSVSMGETTTSFDTALFAPYMSPWAIKALDKLSWRGSRMVHTGPMFERRSVTDAWRTT